jgi:hypothetical protein
MSLLSANPNGTESISPGLRETSYPGAATEKSQTLKGLHINVLYRDERFLNITSDMPHPDRGIFHASIHPCHPGNPWLLSRSSLGFPSVRYGALSARRRGPRPWHKHKLLQPHLAPPGARKTLEINNLQTTPLNTRPLRRKNRGRTKKYHLFICIPTTMW